MPPTGCAIKRMLGGQADGPNGRIPLCLPRGRSIADRLAQPKLPEESGKAAGGATAVTRT